MGQGRGIKYTHTQCFHYAMAGACIGSISPGDCTITCEASITAVWPTLGRKGRRVKDNIRLSGVAAGALY